MKMDQKTENALKSGVDKFFKWNDCSEMSTTIRTNDGHLIVLTIIRKDDD